MDMEADLPLSERLTNADGTPLSAADGTGGKSARRSKIDFAAFQATLKRNRVGDEAANTSNPASTAMEGVEMGGGKRPRISFNDQFRRNVPNALSSGRKGEEQDADTMEDDSRPSDSLRPALRRRQRRNPDAQVAAPQQGDVSWKLDLPLDQLQPQGRRSRAAAADPIQVAEEERTRTPSPRPLRTRAGRSRLRMDDVDEPAAPQRELGSKPHPAQQLKAALSQKPRVRMDGMSDDSNGGRFLDRTFGAPADRAEDHSKSSQASRLFSQSLKDVAQRPANPGRSSYHNSDKRVPGSPAGASKLRMDSVVQPSSAVLQRLGGSVKQDASVKQDQEPSSVLARLGAPMRFDGAPSKPSQPAARPSKSSSRVLDSLEPPRGQSRLRMDYV